MYPALSNPSIIGGPNGKSLESTTTPPELTVTRLYGSLAPPYEVGPIKVPRRSLDEADVLEAEEVAVIAELLLVLALSEGLAAPP